MCLLVSQRCWRMRIRTWAIFVLLLDYMLDCLDLIHRRSACTNSNIWTVNSCLIWHLTVPISHRLISSWSTSDCVANTWYVAKNTWKCLVSSSPLSLVKHSTSFSSVPARITRSLTVSHCRCAILSLSVTAGGGPWSGSAKYRKVCKNGVTLKVIDLVGRN